MKNLLAMTGMTIGIMTCSGESSRPVYTANHLVERLDGCQKALE